MTGLFIGAGASYEVGMPLVKELSMTIRKNVLERLDGTRLFDFKDAPSLRLLLIKNLLDDNLNYEQVLGELEGMLRKGDEIPQAIWSIIFQFLECVHLLLLEDHRNTLAFFRRKANDYRGIVNLVKGSTKPIDVFSLNHDVVFEELCSHYEIPLRDGFFERNNRYQEIASFKILTKKELESGDVNFFEGNERGVNLLKLHGSLDIFSANDKDTFLKTFGHGKKFGSHLDEIEKVERHDLFTSNAAKIRMVNELGVYDSNNEFQFLRRSLLSGAHKFQDHNNQIIPIGFLNLFQKRLDQIDDLTVIGYSFGDGHINLIINNWLKGKNKSVTIYDPRSKKDAVPDCIAEHQAKITIIKAGLTNYFAQYGSPMSSCDRLNILLNQKIRRRLEKKRLLVKISDIQKVSLL